MAAVSQRGGARLHNPSSDKLPRNWEKSRIERQFYIIENGQLSTKNYETRKETGKCDLYPRKTKSSQQKPSVGSDAGLKDFQAAFTTHIMYLISCLAHAKFQ